jgi:hypothetical protein
MHASSTPPSTSPALPDFESITDDAFHLLQSDVGACRQALVMPSPCAKLNPKVLRNLPTRALLVTRNGMLWALDAVGILWHDALIQTVAEIFESNPDCELGQLQYKVQEVAGLSTVRIAFASPLTRESRSWPYRQFFVAACLVKILKGQTDIRTSDIERATQHIEGRLANALQTHFCNAIPEAAFRLDLFPQNLGAIHNFLHHPVHRKYRQQFALVSPAMLEMLAIHSEKEHWKRLRKVIDSGQSVNDYFAAEFQISQHLTRCLLALPVGKVATRWLPHIRTLVNFLGNMIPERRPKTPEQWHELDSLVDLAETQSAKSFHTSFFVRAWVRETWHAGRAQKFLSGAKKIDPRPVEPIEAIYRALQTIVTHTLIAAKLGKGISRLPNPAAGALDQWLMTYSLRQIEKFSPSFLEECTNIDRIEEQIRTVMTNKSYWPLLPDEFISSDQSRRVVPLTNWDQLKRQGRELGICVGGNSYNLACRNGRTYIVAFFDQRSRATASTAELRLAKSARWNSPSPLEITVYQHTGRQNASIGQHCKAAMAELLDHIKTPAIQKHLRMGLLAKNGVLNAKRVPLERFTPLLVDAVTHVFGKEAMDDLLSKCIKACRKNPSAK